MRRSLNHRGRRERRERGGETDAGAALVFRQSELTPEILSCQVLSLLKSPDKLQQMADAAVSLSVKDSAEKLASLVRQAVEK